MFEISKILKEDTGLIAPVFFDNNIKILSMPNLSSSEILYFGVCIYDNLQSSVENHKFCRISMKEPKYINAGGEDLILTKEEIDNIISILSSEHSYFTKGITNWEFLFYNIALSYGREFIKQDVLPMPNYTKLLIERKD